MFPSADTPKIPSCKSVRFSKNDEALCQIAEYSPRSKHSSNVENIEDAIFVTLLHYRTKLLSKTF
jgi:hypothetical protein